MISLFSRGVTKERSSITLPRDRFGHRAARVRFRPLVDLMEGRTLLSILVSNAGDSGTGSLRAAIEQANATPDTITFAPSVTGTIVLSTALPDLASNMVISGPGALVLTVARSAAPGTPDFGIFAVQGGATVTLSGVTIRNGAASFEGGGIHNDGALTLTDAVLDGNYAPFGGGIYNDGTMTITRCKITGGTTESGGLGAGVYNFQPGMLTITDSDISGNTAGYQGLDGAGGGILNSGGTVAVTDSVLSNNSGGSGGGIQSNDGPLTITHCIFSGNAARDGSGGGIWSGGSLTVTGSTFKGNSTSGVSGGGGGGIWTGGTATVTGSVFSGNSADDGGGGIADVGTLTLTNCTFADNTAKTGYGGAINDIFGAVTLVDCTLSGNKAGPGLASGIRSNSGKVTITTSIVANPGGPNFVMQGATFVSLGHNLFSDAPSVALDPTDLVNTDPLLAPLADNGGPTLTQALLPGSPAIDAGVSVSGITTDQRGIPRPQGSAPDIGAFESHGFTLAVVGGDNQRVSAGSAFSAP